MARGFESKSVADQQEGAQRPLEHLAMGVGAGRGEAPLHVGSRQLEAPLLGDEGGVGSGVVASGTLLGRALLLLRDRLALEPSRHESPSQVVNVTFSLRPIAAGREEAARLSRTF